METYPEEILPKVGYSKIFDKGKDFVLIRKCPTSNIFDESTGAIKTEFICQQSKHLINWSCNLYGLFDESHLPLHIVNKSLNDIWNFKDEISSPQHGSDFTIDEEFGYYYLSLSKILNIKVPYKYGETDEFEATLFFSHHPTLCNYFHCEIRYKDKHGEEIDPDSNQKWVNRCSSWLKNNIKHYCLLTIPPNFVQYVMPC